MDIRSGSILDGPGGKPVTIESLLGRGGFGQVFAGRLADGTRVAVKTVLTAGLDQNELRTLQNEATHATTIDHPNVVRVLHVSTGDDDTDHPPYLVMEFVEGGNLRDSIESYRATGTKSSPEELRAMYLQIAAGMAAVNERIVHRDLKPENVLVDAATGRLKIADFGLAKLADAATRSETFKGWGTRPYQAPEAFEHGPNTVSMDVYAAGVVFFELATLAWPVQPRPSDNSPMAWRNAHLLVPPADLRNLRPDLAHDLVQLIMLMLQKDPVRRPSWVSVIERLTKSGVPTVGRPDVSTLVQKATATLAQRTMQEARAREEQERNAERQALLEQAVREPMAVLQNLVDAFNDASEVGKLKIVQNHALSAEVRTSRTKLEMKFHIINDLDTLSHGIFRILGRVDVVPPPSAANAREALRDQNSFGGFNLAYRVIQSGDRFGTWLLLRFEHSPLTGRMTYPRWFAMDFRNLREELQVLNAMGIYQHEMSGLDDEWLKLLLAHLV